MAEAKPLKIQRGDKSLDRANRVVATHIIFHTRRKKARLIPAHPGLEGTIRHTESYTALHKRLGSCPASKRNPGRSPHSAPLHAGYDKTKRRSGFPLRRHVHSGDKTYAALKPATAFTSRKSSRPYLPH